VMMPTSKRAEQLALRDLAPGEQGDSPPAQVEMSEEYRALTRRLATVGTLLSGLVLVTILFMVVKP